MSLFLISRTVSCGKGPFFNIKDFSMWRRILGFFGQFGCGGGFLGVFGQFGYGGGFLVFSVSLDMEEDSWFF